MSNLVEELHSLFCPDFFSMMMVDGDIESIGEDNKPLQGQKEFRPASTGGCPWPSQACLVASLSAHCDAACAVDRCDLGLIDRPAEQLVITKRAPRSVVSPFRDPCSLHSAAWQAGRVKVKQAPQLLPHSWFGILFAHRCRFRCYSTLLLGEFESVWDIQTSYQDGHIRLQKLPH